MHSPLVGQYSFISAVLGRPVRSPGPLLYWLLAIPARLGGSDSLAIWIAAVNLLAVIGTVVLAHRRGGNVLMFATAACMVLMLHAFVPETFHDIDNPSATLLPFVLLVPVAWSVTCGELALLPLMVLLASFDVQTHLGYATPCVLLVLVVVAEAIFGSRHARVARGTRTDARLAPGVRALAASGVVILICWAPPLIDEITHHPGNLTELIRAGTHSGSSPSLAETWDAVVRAVGVVPWWLRSPQTTIERAFETDIPQPVLVQLTAALILAGLVALAVLAHRRGRHDLRRANTVAVALAVAIAVAYKTSPTERGLWIPEGYALWWTTLAGMYAWLFLAWSSWSLLLRPRLPSLAERPWRSGVALASIVVGGLGLAVGLRGKPDVDQSEYRPIRQLVKIALRAVPRHSEVEVLGPADGSAFDAEAAIVFALSRRDTHVETDLASLFGPSYDLRENPAAEGLQIRVGPVGPLSPRAHVLARESASTPSSLPFGSMNGTDTLIMTPDSECSSGPKSHSTQQCRS